MSRAKPLLELIGINRDKVTGVRGASATAVQSTVSLYFYQFIKRSVTGVTMADNQAW